MMKSRFPFTFAYRGRRFHTRGMQYFTVLQNGMTGDLDEWVGFNTYIDLFIWGKTQASLMRQVPEHVAILWETYALKADIQLTNRWLALKRRLLDTFTVTEIQKGKT